MAWFGQFANVVEWEEYRDDVLFWKWTNREIKKGSRLVLKPGQDAIFLYNGKVEGIFADDGEYDIESDIVPFLSTLKGFKFGFNSGMRAEVLFTNTKEINVKWGTKNPINIPAPGLPGGMPIKSFGTFDCKIDDHNILIEKIAGIKHQYHVDDLKDRVIALLDQLLMKWISREGKDMFNLQANSFDIAKGIREDLDMEMRKIGIAITNFNISSFSYPEEIQRMQQKAAGQSMVGDVDRYTQISMADSLGKESSASSVAGSVIGMQMGMAMGQKMGEQAQQSSSNKQEEPSNNDSSSDTVTPKFCPNCGTKNDGSKFCPNCGHKLK
ncbi:MAG: SPFH domain-containing protein [Caldisericia bacterium]|nr:SPFH domain-containing protein [Caldisericia bacterium]MDD4614309.1 SPFH domain-containing protein [Caldisericia bacterium]